MTDVVVEELELREGVGLLVWGDMHPEYARVYAVDWARQQWGRDDMGRDLIDTYSWEAATMRGGHAMWEGGPGDEARFVSLSDPRFGQPYWLLVLTEWE